MDTLWSLSPTRQSEILDILRSAQCMKILALLSDNDYYASGISERIEISFSTISYYIRKLSSAKLIDINQTIDDLRKKKVRLNKCGRLLLSSYRNGKILNPIVFGKK